VKEHIEGILAYVFSGALPLIHPTALC